MPRGDLNYPVRGIRTMGAFTHAISGATTEPGRSGKWKAVGAFGDCGGSSTMEFILDRRKQAEFAKFFDLTFAK